jgi:uncharacterized membrane protein YhiD involved in acid resistance
MLDYQMLQVSSEHASLLAVIYGIGLSFLLGVGIALIYNYTFRGLSYSKNFLHALVLCPIVSTIAMQAIGDNLARGLGMMGAISLLRFRSNLKDPRDMFFLFAAMAIGIANGVHAYSIACVGSLGFILSVLVLDRVDFVTPAQFDGLLRFNFEPMKETRDLLETTLSKHCRTFSLVTLREMAQGNRFDYAYQVKLSPKSSFDVLIEDIKTIPTVKGTQLLMQESTIEV